MENKNNSNIEFGRFYGKTELAIAYGLTTWRSLKKHLSGELREEIKELGAIRQLKPNIVKKIYDEFSVKEFDD
ncbi:MAG: hypothetical protein ACI8ZM_002480 [Crocinitomix sp.]|jgi:hypothetical protein